MVLNVVNPVVHGGQQYGANMVWSSVIGALGNIAGGVIGSIGQSNANDRAADSAANNLAKQEEFARNSVRWRAQDVMRAYDETGIHPLALLGVQGTNFSPVAVNFGNEGAPIGEALGRAGSDISRAINAGADRELREKALALQEQQLVNATEKGALENEWLRMRIQSEHMRIKQMSNPAIPSPNDVSVIKGQGDITKGPGVERKVIPDVSVARNPDGSLIVVPSDAVKNRIEDMFGLSSQWWLRNILGPVLSESNRDRFRHMFGDPFGTYREYQPLTGKWVLRNAEYNDPFKYSRGYNPHYRGYDPRAARR